MITRMMAIIMTTTTTMTMTKAKAPLRSSPRKRGPRNRDNGLDSRLRGNEQINPAALYRLMAWLSPAYPIGAFSYSSGIEWAVEAGDIKDAGTLRRWLTVMLANGGGFSDAVFFAHAHRAAAAGDDAELHSVAELTAAFVPSKERFLETTAQGRAFLDATRAAWPCPALKSFDATWGRPVALPVAVGVAADTGAHAMPRKASFAPAVLIEVAIPDTMPPKPVESVKL